MAKKRASRKPPRPVGIAEPTPEMLPFLHGIRDDPADDAPRLVFADWLEENGYPTWAELMRVQCELDRLPNQVMRRECAWQDREAIARRRESARDDEDIRLLDLIGREHACLRRPEELPLFLAREGERRDFERGLPVWYYGAEDLSELRAAYEAAPSRFDWLDTLAVISERPGIVPESVDLLARPMRWTFQIELDSEAPASYAGWADIPVLGRLRRLSVSFVHDPDAEAGFAAITRLPCAMLERFELFIRGFDATRLDLLAGAPWPSLRSLRIGNSHMSSDQFRRLAERMGPRLEGIELASNEMGSSALMALCEHGLFRGVAFVANQGAPLSDAAIRALADCPEACNLTALHLGRSGLTDAGLLMIANSPHLRHVCDLFVGDNRLTDDGVAGLVVASNARNYERLYLEGNPIGDGAVGALAGADLPNLGDLNLDEIRMSPEGALALTTSRNRENFAEISLQGNKISANVRKALREHFGQRLIL